MKELRLITAKHPWGNYMVIIGILKITSFDRNGLAAAADEVQFLGMLLKMLNAKKNTMEIGVYTGYSLLAAALALPDDGKGPVVHDVRENMMDSSFDQGSRLLVICVSLAWQEKHKGSLDFVFVDADKENYHKRVRELVRVGGVIGYDNTLWNGSVAAPPEAPLPDHVRRLRGPILELNKYVAADPRVEICQLSIADGLTLCRRLS
ncbi:Caffeoyl-CoA O-methyltransferase [Cocos nucifera]|uniref:Caffeoyl-CoA O-methyltransferase n=1 Tax=Cocos nucifera TaxID=13894 RepID=A0A8K0IPJ7_COCNU|nr:Caffeoyl-CoA O-methyltransferase [Cocos nucifera]